jgi:hypothetical protein
MQGNGNMTEPKPAAKFAWHPDRKMLIVSDATGATSLAFPIIGLPAIGFQAQKFMAGDRAKLAKEEAQRERTGWLGISAPTAQTARVQTMQTLQGERIVLIFDPDTDAEYPASFATRELARQVGEALIEASNARPLSTTTKN